MFFYATKVLEPTVPCSAVIIYKRVLKQIAFSGGDNSTIIWYDSRWDEKPTMIINFGMKTSHEYGKLIMSKTMTLTLDQAEYILIEKSTGFCFLVDEDPAFPGASLLTYKNQLVDGQYEEIKEKVLNPE